jgi:hypothetical protein
MPRYEQHTAQAEHNEIFLNFLTGQGKQTEYSDWYVTVAFYAALHHFEAVLSVTPEAGFDHSPNHVTRNRTIKTVFVNLYRPYVVLYEMSRTARYDCHAPSTHNWADAEVYLDDVKKECEALVRNKK